MNIVIGSAHRNNVGRLSTYFTQVGDLREALRPHTLRVIAVEGDSRDNTRTHLVEHSRRLNLDLTLVTCNHGGPHYPSTESPERMVALSKVGNAILDAVLPTDDILVYIESDLLWTSTTITRLISYVTDCRDGFDIFSPLVMAGKVFYDIYLFRKNGERFSPFHPYHPSLLTHEVFEVDSAGSCLVMNASIARDTRIRMVNGALLDWCAAARAHDYKIAVARNLSINHPA